jgi:hypothetical protein
MIEYFNEKVDKILDGRIKSSNPDEQIISLMRMIKEYEEVLEEKLKMQEVPEELQDLNKAIDSLYEDFEDES